MNTASSPARFNMTRLRLDLAEVTAQRNALLAALQTIVSDKGSAQFNDDLEAYDAALAVARAAIATAQE